jgi:outer membrane protein assembly factor BamA
MQRRIVVALLLALPVGARAQSPTPSAPHGWQISGLPALNFNADEGFGYGLIAQAFNYGNGGVQPYAYLIEPLVFLTTKGRRDLTVFFDAPHLLPGDWRWGAFVGREQQLATPYYGIGNNTPYDKANEAAPNPYFYRYGRVGIRFSTDLQRPIMGPLRLLVGAGTRTSKINDTPFDSGTTLLRGQTGGVALPSRQATYLRAGLVFDTRDRETGPTHGQWTELLVQRGAKLLGSDYDFTRITGTARVYVPVTERFVFAERVTVQNLQGSVPFYEMSTTQGSFSDDEGLGGSGSVRGWPKNRFIGKGMMFANQELRWRVSDFSLRRRPSALVLSGFVDAGRVWDSGLSSAGLLSDLHVGYGGGARLRYGQDFVVGFDVGHSKESGAAIYIGLGYPY